MPCDITLAYAEPCVEVYVCWVHRKVWIIDTTYISPQIKNPPKTCDECQKLIAKSKEMKEKIEKETLYEDMEW